MLNLIADQAWNPFAPFGVTSWEPFVANLIAFILMVVILRYLAFKPIQNVLKRRRRIEEGEEMREESERQLASVKEQTHEMLVEAGEKGQEKIDAAKAAAARLLEEQEAEASRKAEEIVKKARQLAELEQQKEREALKRTIWPAGGPGCGPGYRKNADGRRPAENQPGSDRQPGFLKYL